MSKLADRIRKTIRTELAPMGFAAAARTQQQTMLIVASLASGDAGKTAEAFEKGADVVVVEGAETGKLKDKAGTGITGVSLRNATREQVAELKGAGVDFVVLDSASTLAETLLEESIGFVLTAPENAEDTTLRLLGDLGLDALVVRAPAEPLTLEALLGLRRVAALARLPMLVSVSPDIAASRLHALRDSGVAGVLVEGSSLGKLGQLRETIAGLPARGRKREEKNEATISAGAVVGHSHDDDDYDDDDD